MRNITVTPAELIACASRMEENRAGYDQYVRDLYDTVGNLQAHWQGADNSAFTSEIQRYESTLRTLSVLCSQYSDFLRSSANAYETTQQELTSMAGKLPG